ncbi:MAG: adenylate/guanylate cyclase domain-containing protein [Candidatus Ozemobacteraceae bacterium]
MSRQSNVLPRIAYIVRGMLVWIIIVVVPVLFADRLVQEYFHTQEESQTLDRRDHAASLLVRLEKTLNRQDLLHGELTRFCRRFPAPGMDATSTRALENAFRRRFPTHSRLFRFDQEGHLLPSGDGIPPVEGTRVWQAFHRIITQGKRASDADQRLASKLVVTLMGRFLPLSAFGRLPRKPMEVLIRGRLHIFGFLNFSSDHGSLLVLIPLYDAPQGWELRYAVKRLSTPEEAVGGIWTSNGRTMGGDPLSPGILDWLANEYRSGNAVASWAGNFFLIRAYSRDPSLLLTVGVRESTSPRLGGTPTKTSDYVGKGQAGTRFSGASGFLLISRFLLAAIVLLTGICTGYFTFRRIELNISLEAKFRFAAALLASVPLAAALLVGLRDLGRLERNLRVEADRRLKDRLDQLEQEIAEQQAFLGNRLSDLSKNSFLALGTDLEKIPGLLEPFKRDLGLNRSMYIHTNGKRQAMGWDSHSGSRVAELQLELIQRILKTNNFQTSADISKKRISTEAQAIFGALRLGSEATAKTDVFKRFQCGPLAWYFFQMFYSVPGNVTSSGYMNLFFTTEAVTRYLLRQAVERLPRDDIRLFFRIPREGTQTPARSLLAQSLERVEQSGIESTERIPTTGRIPGKCQVWHAFSGGSPEKDDGNLLRIRLLRGVQGTVAALFPLGSGRAPLHRAEAFLLGLLLVSLAAAWLAADLLRALLLEPLHLLGNALSSVDQGHFVPLSAIVPGDELGDLRDRFNVMATGLAEKARMTSFLRSDLVERVSHANTESAPAATRCDAVVLFAGIRDFSKREAELSPEQAMQIMSEYLGLCESCVRKHGGEIDKFLGDAAMAVFTTQIDSFETAAEKALEAALLLARTARETMPRHSKDFRFGIGIAAGSVMAGSIGSQRKRLDYTVIGDPVNLAARLEKLAGRDGVPAIVTDDSFFRLHQQGFSNIPIGKTSERGSWKELPIHHVRGRAGKIRVWGLEI